MNDKNYILAKRLILIPIFVLVCTIICFVLAIALESVTNKGIIYTLFALIGLISAFLSPLPCMIMTIIGTVFAVKAIKEGSIKARVFFAIGLIEIAAIILVIMIVVGLFNVSMGV